MVVHYTLTSPVADPRPQTLRGTAPLEGRVIAGYPEAAPKSRRTSTQRETSARDDRHVHADRTTDLHTVLRRDGEILEVSTFYV